jgi:hypothetical protein
VFGYGAFPIFVLHLWKETEAEEQVYKFVVILNVMHRI